jgi:YHS domain-containing protein
MSERPSLADRIDAEFSALDQKIERARTGQMQEYREREARLAEFGGRLEELREVWKPRLDALVERFGSRARVAPEITESGREVELDFQSELARIRLRLSATTDRDVRRLILSYDLEIIPVLMRYDSHAQGEWPLDALDQEAVATWVDDRIVDFVKTYLSLHENEYYLKEHMVTDPVAGVRFPSFAAAATVEWGGKRYHFIGEETRRAFEERHGIAAH